jgi:hypothetical protein
LKDCISWPKFTATLSFWLLSACAAVQPPSAEIQIDLSGVNAEGLRGPSNGLRAVHYEFCIPAGETYKSEVVRIDASAVFMPDSRGRIGCRAGEVLVVGNTHQPGYRQVLDRLASLPYIERIVEAHFE